MNERIENIRNGLMKTKPHEVWQEDIVFICNYLINRYYDFVLDEPDGWNGFSEVTTDEYVISEQGKAFVCRNLLLDKEKGWMIKLTSGEGCISILRVRNIASYAAITKALLNAVDKVDESYVNIWGCSPH